MSISGVNEPTICECHVKFWAYSNNSFHDFMTFYEQNKNLLKEPFCATDNFNNFTNKVIINDYTPL